MNRIFVVAAVLGIAWAYPAKAARGQDPSTRHLLLRPARGPSLRIDFDYRFSAALPAFAKEPSFPGKEICRGLIPTVPPTRFIRNVTDNALYVNEDHNQDFLTGKLATYTSTYHGHVEFRSLRLSTIREALVIPYTVDLYTYEHGCSGWLDVQSAWESPLTLDGRDWRLGIVDNLDGQIDGQDTLYLRDNRQRENGPLILIRPLPQILSLAGHTFALDYAFKQSAADVMIEAALTGLHLPSGRLNLEAKGCRYLRLQSERVAVLLDAGASPISLPADDYRLADCILEPDPSRLPEPQFHSSDRQVSIRPDQTALLRAGLPLRNSVLASRDRNLLRLTYQLLGAGGEQYSCYDWDRRPRFNIYKGPLRLASGILPFG